MRKQIAVWWSLDSLDDYGKPVYKESEEISCRWEDVSEEFIAADGTRQVSRSKIYTGQDIKVGDVLMLGEKDSNINEEEPKENENAWEVRSFTKTPNIKATKFLRVAYL